MKRMFKKTLFSLGLTTCAVCAISSVSFASIDWNSTATAYGSGGRANINATTSQSNESYNYQISVKATTNDGSTKSAIKNPAKATDLVNVNFTTTGAVSSGTSYHEWVMSGESGSVNKSIDFQY